jgi:hypothetical protein
MGRRFKAELERCGKPGRPSSIARDDGLQNSAAQSPLERAREGQVLATACAQEYLDTKETARRLNVSPSFLNKARLTGDGPPFCKFAKTVRYYWPTVVAWAASCSRSSTSDGQGRTAPTGVKGEVQR